MSETNHDASAAPKTVALHDLAFSRRKELRALGFLSAPIIISLVAQNLMGIVDTLLIGPLGAGAVASVGLGVNCYFGVVFPLACLLLGVDAVVSQAIGAKKPEEAKSAFMQSLYLAGLASVLQVPGLIAIAYFLPSFGVQPDIARGAATYLLPLCASAPMLTFHYAATRYLQAQSRPRPVMIVAIAGNILNAFLVRLLAFHFGYGIAGAAVATLIARTAMAVALLWVAWPRGEKTTFIAPLFFRLLRLGTPAAAQVMAEIGIFVVSGILIARFDAAWMASHHIVLQLASFTFMFPQGISQSAAVRVGEAVGAKMPSVARARGFVAIASAAGVMTCFGFALWFGGPLVATLATGDPVVTAHTANLVRFAAAFQLFDGLQIAITGALRGFGDTRTPFFINFAGYWLIAFPIGLWLTFTRGWGPPGIWCALMIGLILVGSTLLVTYTRRRTI